MSDSLEVKLKVLISRFDTEYGSDKREGNLYRAMRENQKVNEAAHANIIKRLDIQNGRVQKLEASRNIMGGGLAVIIFVISLSIPIFIHRSADRFTRTDFINATTQGVSK